jgi:hypothetical protein
VSEAADTFDVVVTGFDPGGEPPVLRLQRVFGLAGPAAERLLTRLPAPVQRGVPRIRAEYFRRALLKIGAHVEVRDGQGASVEPLPTVPPPAPHRLSERPSRVAPLPSTAPPSAPQSPPPSVIPRPAPVESERFELDEDDDIPLAASLRPDLLQASVVAPLTLDSVPPPAAAPPPAVLAVFGATADTMVDSRQRPSAAGQVPQPVWTSAATALPGPAPVGAPARDTLADAQVRMPASPTLRDGVPIVAPVAPASAAAASPWGSLSTPGPSAAASAGRAGATVMQGAAVVPQPAKSAQAPLFGDLPVPPQAAPTPGFRPPPLELGLDSGDMMSKLPSSIWDAPPPAYPDGSAPAGAAKPAVADPNMPKRTGGTLLDLPGASAAVLDLTGAARPTASIDAPLDLPSMAPAKGRAPLAVARPAAPLRAAAVGPVGSVASDAPVAGPRGRPKPGAKAAKAKRSSTEPEEREPIVFWEALQPALSLPLTGTGTLWIGVIALCAVLGALLTAGSMVLVPLGVVVAFCSLTLLLALSCDYFRACFWLADVDATALERGPSLEPARLLHTYLKSGAQLTVFALVTGLPLIFVTIAGIAEGATPLDVFASPSTWFLGFLSALVWPGAVAMSALHNRFEAIWQLPRALGLIAKAPLEYLAVVLIGGLTFGAGVWILLALASAAGISGALLGATLGLPMALGHGIQGALMGNLMRAHPELFR